MEEIKITDHAHNEIHGTRYVFETNYQLPTNWAAVIENAFNEEDCHIKNIKLDKEKDEMQKTIDGLEMQEESMESKIINLESELKAIKAGDHTLTIRDHVEALNRLIG